MSYRSTVFSVFLMIVLFFALGGDLHARHRRKKVKQHKPNALVLTVRHIYADESLEEALGHLEQIANDSRARDNVLSEIILGFGTLTEKAKEHPATGLAERFSQLLKTVVRRQKKPSTLVATAIEKSKYRIENAREILKQVIEASSVDASEQYALLNAIGGSEQNFTPADTAELLNALMVRAEKKHQPLNSILIDVVIRDSAAGIPNEGKALVKLLERKIDFEKVIEVVAVRAARGVPIDGQAGVLNALILRLPKFSSEPVVKLIDQLWERSYLTTPEAVDLFERVAQADPHAKLADRLDDLKSRLSGP